MKEIAINSKSQVVNRNLKSQNSSVPQRVDWIGYAKGIAMFLVVLEHTLQGLANASMLDTSGVFGFLDQWISTFHMPLLFFIAGLSIQRFASKPLINFIVDKLQVIAYPYFLWSVLQSILQGIASPNSNSLISLADIRQIIYGPMMQFWFLYILFLMMVIYGITYKVGVSSISFLGFSILLYGVYLVGISFGSWGVFYLFSRYVIYFALGALIGSGKLVLFLNRIKTPVLISVILGGFLAVVLAVGIKLVESEVVIPLIAMLGISASIALAILLERFNLANVIKLWGWLSLQIYVAHTIAVSLSRVILYQLFGFTEPFLHLLLGTAVGIYAPIALDLFCRELQFRYMFTLRIRRY